MAENEKIAYNTSNPLDIRRNNSQSNLVKSHYNSTKVIILILKWLPLITQFVILLSLEDKDCCNDSSPLFVL
jgi:membrane protein YqaA with SNARE-associated domain